MGKPKAPAPPDYSPIIQASQQQSAQQMELANKEFSWAQGAYAHDSAISDQVAQADIAAQKQSADLSKQQFDQYQKNFEPINEQYSTDVQNYGSPAFRDQMTAAASATAGQSFDAQRQSAAQNLESYGVDPSATRYAALDASYRVAKAAGQAGAATSTGLNIDTNKIGIEHDAAATGMGIATGSDASTNTGVAAGGAAVNAGLATTQSGASSMGTAPQYMAGANASLGTWGNTLNQGYSNQVDAYKAEQASSSGIGSIFGSILGGSSWSSKAGLTLGLSEGGAIPAPGGTSRGGGVPVNASPSRGRAIDDVPARLTPGEFVVPKDAVAWKGEEFFQKLIKKTREDRQQNAPAQPKVMHKPAASVSQPSAIPMTR